MSFISYAQNLEDVMLYRAFKHVERGFYIDVGAHHPVSDSITKAFYDRGWHGINIEPSHEYFQLLRQERPEDINLNVALGDHKGHLVYHEVPHTGMSTVKKAYADRYAEAGYEVQSYTVPCTTLDVVCAEHEVDTVHFLKIDVEGMEEAVLRGFAFAEVRPWIVVIEANEPLSSHDVSEDWEPMLLTRGYECIYYDGLNRFYLAAEHSGLQEHFQSPPNIFDQYVAYAHWSVQQELAISQKRLSNEQAQREALAAQLQLTQQELAGEQAQREALAAQLQQVYASHSWRLTGPVRKTKLTLFSLPDRLVRLSWRSTAGVLRVLVRFSPVRRLGARLLTGHPEFKARLRRFIGMDTPPLAGAAPPDNVVPVKRYTLLRYVLKSSLNVLNRFPRLKRRVRRAIARFPRFEKRLFQAWLDITWADILNHDDFKPASPIATPNNLNTALAPICFPESGLTTPQKRCIYYWIDHTVEFQTNTGVQRVTRCLAAGLMELGTEIVFVRWDKQGKALTKATRSDLEHLSSMNGPRFSPEFLASYASATESSRLLHEQVGPEQLSGAWLMVPEVTHITIHDSPPTLDIIDYARAYGMKTAFIFYDAIPLKLEEYAATAKVHAEYMQHLTLADLVLPISQFAAGDLDSYLTHQLNFHPETLPMTKPVLLPGEICGMPRMTEYDNPEEELIILSIGSVEPRKNQIVLMEAFQHLCERFPEAPLRLVLSGNISTVFAPVFYDALQRSLRVEYVKYVSDKKLLTLYQKCVFTVFPSVEEGFGLPIVESLWYGRPVICANFGSMAEIAQGGGCLMIDTRSVAEMENAMERMLFDKQLRERLAAEAISRPILSWREYAEEILTALHSFDDPARRIKKLYYWVDHTCNHPANSEIQRVVRGLASTLQSTGVPLVPVKWDNATHSFCSPSEEEIVHLAAWNGSDPAGFSRFTMSGVESGAWLLIPELTSNLGDTGLDEVGRKAKSMGLHTAIVFYDTLPYKLAQLYPPEATRAHTNYMKKLMKFDCILPISNASSADLQAFLFQHADRLVNVAKKLNPVILPGEFREHPRVTTYEEPETSPIRILCVSTIEPRKNHLMLLESFDKISREESIDVELVLVGHCAYPELEEKVNGFLERNRRIHWLRHVDDATLGEEYSRCHFTVYPSLDEGFGLTVLESLWYARPCICRNTGALAETAEGGGCLTVDTSNIEELARTMALLATDKETRARLGEEAVSRRLKTWDEYARDVLNQLARRTENHDLEPSVKPAPWPLPATVKQPLLSICITTYNRAKWLALSLKTLMRWTEPYRDLIEVIVCDNASKDNTREVAEPYFKKKNFLYHCNPENVGMLGNLRVTAHLAQGKYVWILGDDDLVKEGAVESIISAIRKYPDLSLIYLNYAYTTIADATEVKNLDEFLRDSTPIGSPTPDQYAKIKDIAAKSENFFTAIYCLVFRHDHAIKVYSQNTSGRPFSTMLTCIPTSYYVYNYMFEEMGLWVGQPSLVVNMNVSWPEYQPLYGLERFPELYELAEEKGADPDAVDRWRARLVPTIINYLNRIYFDDKVGNLSYFSIDRLFQRYKHVSAFRDNLKAVMDIYRRAYYTGRAAGSVPPEALIQRYNLSIM